MSWKEEIRILHQEREINNAPLPQELMLFNLCAQLGKMQGMLGMCASVETSPRVPLRTGNLGVVEMND